MIQVDLITGFLGSGKTTFIRKYVSYLVKNGTKVGIIENDFGAINIDMVMLSDMESEKCSVEQIVGGNVETDWKRRFKAKLIALAMQGFQRIVVEPSGIYDVDAFFDVLYDEPVNNWYEPGNIIAVADAISDANLSKQARYLMTSQIAKAGCIMLSKTKNATNEQIQETIVNLNSMLEEFKADRRLSDDIYIKDWNELSENEMENIVSCGWKSADHEKLWFNHNDAFMSLFLMETDIKKKDISEVISTLMKKTDCGKIFRIKGFVKDDSDNWFEINATQNSYNIKQIDNAQPVIIIIGENLQERIIKNEFTKNI